MSSEVLQRVLSSQIITVSHSNGVLWCASGSFMVVYRTRTIAIAGFPFGEKNCFRMLELLTTLRTHEKRFLELV